MEHEESSTTDGCTHVMLEMIMSASYKLNDYVLESKKPPPHRGGLKGHINIYILSRAATLDKFLSYAVVLLLQVLKTVVETRGFEPRTPRCGI